MSARFSSDDSSLVDRGIEENHKSVSNLSEIWNVTRLEECKSWIEKADFKKVCLQFPDNLLCYSAHITTELNEATNDVELFILGDTSYGSCCVDEVAAEHVAADAIIHFGHACLSRAVRLPLSYVFPNFYINPLSLHDELIREFPLPLERLMIFYNIGYLYNLQIIKDELNRSYKNIEYGTLAINSESATLGWAMEKVDLQTYTACIYVGEDNQTFFNLTLSLNAKVWYIFDPESGGKMKRISAATTNWMKRRYFYIEKCKDAQTLGIVVGTLATKGYLDVVKHIQALARNRGVRTYIISVGKVNPSKLANFMEIDCFVLVGCPENNLFTSRDFYKPLLSVFEVEVALNPAWHEQLPTNYCVDFKEFLPTGQMYRDYKGHQMAESDVSLVTGKVRFTNHDDENKETNNCEGTIELKKNHQLLLTDSENSFQNRTWNGLDPALGKTEPVKIQQGRSGLAIKYSNDDE